MAIIINIDVMLAFITVTSAPPDHPDRDPLVARLVLGPFTPPAAKIRAPTPNG